MEDRSDDYGRVYGYSACLVAILAFLYGGTRLAGAVLDARELLYTEEYRSGPSLVSEDVYRMELSIRAGDAGAGGAAAVLPPDSTIRRMYDQERKYRLALSHQRTRRSIAVNLFLVVAAAGIFAGHAWWLRRRREPPP